MRHLVDDFKLGDRVMRYSLFAPRLYNFCLSLGFRREFMMPSRAFCSDESQGYPVILLTQHFGTFPFDHGRIGGKVATDRHSTLAHHGEDVFILQASHVGYDPVHQRFGVYERFRTFDHGFGDACGKLSSVLHWYQKEYNFAGKNIFFDAVDGQPAVFVDNDFLDDDRSEGLFLNLDRLIAQPSGDPLKVLATSKAFAPAPALVAALAADVWKKGRLPIGDRLRADMFFFRREPVPGPEGLEMLEATIAPAMPAIVTSAYPPLDAARYHTQVEFDRTYRSVLDSQTFDGKNLLLIAGVNIDVSPAKGAPFPLNKFVPWAAYYQLRDGGSALLEQDELVQALLRQPTTNPDKMSFDAAIEAMTAAQNISLPI